LFRSLGTAINMPRSSAHAFVSCEKWQCTLTLFEAPALRFTWAGLVAVCLHPSQHLAGRCDPVPDFAAPTVGSAACIVRLVMMYGPRSTRSMANNPEVRQGMYCCRSPLCRPNPRWSCRERRSSALC